MVAADSAPVGRRSTPIVDAQIHVYERNHPGRPWQGTTTRGATEATGEDVIGLMDATNVDGAILVSVYSRYGYDVSYAVDVAHEHPDRFAVVAPVDPLRPDIDEYVRRWRHDVGGVGLRTMVMNPTDAEAVTAGAHDRFLAAASAESMPVCVFAPGRADLVAVLAERFPELTMVIDHVGLPLSFSFPPPPDRFAMLADVLALARFHNVVIKLTAVPTLSMLPFPYTDIWGPVARVIDAFGVGRTMWGTDYTRATNILSYEEGVRAFTEATQLSGSDRDAVLGGTAIDVFAWAPDAGRATRDRTAALTSDAAFPRSPDRAPPASR